MTTWRVHTGSRLHFGLIAPAPPTAWPDRTGAPVIPSRLFGGVGLMIATPGVTLRVEPADAWGAEGPLAARALEFARRCAATTGDRPARRLVVEACAPEHAGLGTGTQLGQAVAAALAASWGEALPAEELARRSGRGLRSGLGVHGFARGGFLVDGGKRGLGVAPLVARADFPAGWRVVLTLPPAGAGAHGGRERAAFASLAERPVAEAEALCRLVLLGLLPALVEADFPAFAEALGDYNARAGAAFAPEQGGEFGGVTAGVVAWLRGRGLRGVGQSSWGPVAFALTPDPDAAEHLARALDETFPGSIVWVSAGWNQGAELAPAEVTA